MYIQYGNKFNCIANLTDYTLQKLPKEKHKFVASTRAPSRQPTTSRGTDVLYVCTTTVYVGTHIHTHTLEH